MKKKLAKIAALSMAAVSLVLVTVLVTVAFLTSKSNQITNTFTVGNVMITMDESIVSEDGTVGQGRHYGNKYRLVPGKTYVKDPIVHVQAQSEASYLFVEISNGIADIEPETGSGKTIEEQMEKNHWVKITTSDSGDVYVYAKDGDYATQIDSSDAVQDIHVFETFTVADDKIISTYDNVVLTAYAIQAEGVSVENTNDVVEAWMVVKGAQ